LRHNLLIAAAALASCLAVPGLSQAQSRGLTSFGNTGYGIFGGDGSGLSGQYNGGYTASFGRNYAYSTDQYSNLANVANQGGNVQTLSRYGLGTSTYGNTLSPYLNLLRGGGSSAAVNYYGIVRPQIESQRDWATAYKQAERQGENELRARQGLDNLTEQFQEWATQYKQAELEGEKQARIRNGEPGEAEYKDWASTYKDQEIKGEAKAEKDRSRSRQRAANLRQAQAMKELEAELTASTSGPSVTPGLDSGLTQYQPPGTASQFRSMQHYYPTQGAPVSRIGGGSGGGAGRGGF
jgi:hypothetical protein